MIRGMWHDDNAAGRATEPRRVESARTVPCRRVTKTGWAAMGRGQDKMGEPESVRQQSAAG
jgi:hypothetical protein